MTSFSRSLAAATRLQIHDGDEEVCESPVFSLARWIRLRCLYRRLYADPVGESHGSWLEPSRSGRLFNRDTRVWLFRNTDRFFRTGLSRCRTPRGNLVQEEALFSAGCSTVVFGSCSQCEYAAPAFACIFRVQHIRTITFEKHDEKTPRKPSHRAHRMAEGGGTRRQRRHHIDLQSHHWRGSSPCFARQRIVDRLCGPCRRRDVDGHRRIRLRLIPVR